MSTVEQAPSGHVSGIVGAAVLAGAPTLAPGEVFAINMAAPPKFGCNRQGGCNEINYITDSVLGPCLEMTTNDSDHTLPGTNSPPLGGCYAVHRIGGVSSCLIAPIGLTHDKQWFIRLKVAIPSSQPSLSGGFPKTMAGKWLSLHESYGPPFAGAAVTNLAVNNDANGQPNFVYGPASQPHSFWTPVVFDRWMDFVIAMTPSTSASVGSAAVTCNGTPLKSKAGNLMERYATLTAADWGGGPSNPGNLICYIQNYRSIPWGGTLRILFADFRIGTTLASVGGSGSAPPPPPVPGTPPPTTLTLSAAQDSALKRYIGTHGFPPAPDGPLIQQILAEL